MQKPSLPNYTDIINNFWADNTRGCDRFEIIYKRGRDFAYSLLLGRSWHRFYCWKRSCKWLGSHDKEWSAIEKGRWNKHYLLHGKRLCSNFLKIHLGYQPKTFKI